MKIALWIYSIFITAILSFTIVFLGAMTYEALGWKRQSARWQERATAAIDLLEYCAKLPQLRGHEDEIPAIYYPPQEYQ